MCFLPSFSFPILLFQHKEAFLKANPNYKWSGEKGQTGAPRSARKAESGHVTKSTEDSSSSRAMPLSEAEGKRASKPMTILLQCTVICSILTELTLIYKICSLTFTQLTIFTLLGVSTSISLLLSHIFQC